MSMSIIKQTELRYCEGTSDKVYIAKIIKIGSVYTVPCEYGRRGYSLKSVDKGTYETITQANNAFDKVVASKVAKGYSVHSVVVKTGSVLCEQSSLDPVASIADSDFVSADDSKECGESAKEKALARLRAACAW